MYIYFSAPLQGNIFSQGSCPYVWRDTNIFAQKALKLIFFAWKTTTFIFCTAQHACATLNGIHLKPLHIWPLHLWPLHLTITFDQYILPLYVTIIFDHYIWMRAEWDPFKTWSDQRDNQLEAVLHFHSSVFYIFCPYPWVTTTSRITLLYSVAFYFLIICICTDWDPFKTGLDQRGIYQQQDMFSI